MSAPIPAVLRIDAHALLEALARHPMGKRLRFVDPLSPEITRLATAPAYWSGPAPLPSPPAAA